jgi:flagellar basal body rod protein FlgF
MAVLGSGGPIVLPADGEVRVDTDGNVWADQTTPAACRS